MIINLEDFVINILWWIGYFECVCRLDVYIEIYSFNILVRNILNFKWKVYFNESRNIYVK